MVSSKNIIQMASKWQKEVTNYQRRRLLWPKTHENAASSEWKGHFVVYCIDKKPCNFGSIILNCLCDKLLLLDVGFNFVMNEGKVGGP